MVYHQSVIFNSSEIILKINEIGMNTILSKRNLNISYLCPSQIILNNVIQNLSDCSQININEPGSIVKLVWDTPLHSVNSLFEYCYNIKEIKFLNFDTSLLTYMSWVFQFCYSLTSVDLSNLNISNVSAIRFMFNNCISLKSLNLSNFDTSNTTYMNMNNLFYNCKNLEYINLLNFTDNKNPTKQEMFTGIAENAVICIDQNKDPLLYDIIDVMPCVSISCRPDWKNVQYRLSELGDCIINCTSTYSRYESSGKCYDICEPNCKTCNTEEYFPSDICTSCY